jgi:DNA repair photolyase
VSDSQLRWELADAPHAQSALFDESIFEREPGRGEFRGLEFLHVRAKRIINDLGGTPYGFRYTINAYRGCSHACAYCASGDTLILMEDGRTKRLGDIRVGDRVVGTRRIGHYHRYVGTTVRNHWSTTKMAYRITLIDGTTLIASADHRFLSNRGWKHVTGTEQGRDCRPHLTLNNELIGTGRFAEGPKADDDYRRGYLCGMIRGDGTVGSYTYPRGRSTNTVHRFRLALADMEALDRAREYLDLIDVPTQKFLFAPATDVHREVWAIRASTKAAVTAIRNLVGWPDMPTESWVRGFLAGVFDAEGGYNSGVFRISNNDLEIVHWICRCLERLNLPFVVEPQTTSRCGNVRLLGGLVNVLRFFHLTDPVITRKRDITGHALKSKCHLNVVSIEPLGIEIPMYDITTGTGDFIANGVVSHNCFARPTHAYLDLNIGDDFDRKIVVKVNAVERVRAELHPRRWTGEPIAMGTNTDPYQRCEGKYRLTQGIIEALIERANAFSILTKSTLILRDLDLLVEASQRADVRVNFSIGTLDEHVWRTTEPGTPHPRQRIKAVEALNNAGVRCGVLVAPILPGLSDRPDQLEDVVRACKEAGAVSITPVLLHLGNGTKDVFYDRIGDTHPELLPMYRRMYGSLKYAPKADRDRVTSTVNKMIGKRVTIRAQATSKTAPRPTQLNLL